MEVLDDIVELLEDEEWHTEEEVGKKLGLSTFKVKLLLNFLESYGFAQYDPPHVQIKHRIVEFFKELGEREDKLGSFCDGVNRI